ncbi:phage portal protein [Paenibacillus sp. CAA11]|uniref:XkdQ/YqbQ family protein n=1 Tax=Paenibacillus sp. CAA11 TaxID=1532905 RepID=UPI000D3726DF|nr:phage portal protein [Paenibacillus sp. CAA11]AWB45318.1 phage portal protein [Paenibacillus sp. CAA11]
MSYKVILQNKYDLTPLVQSISLKDSLEQIAYQGNVELVAGASMPSVTPGDEIRISGVPLGKTEMVPLLHPAVVWDCDSSSNNGAKRISLTLYDRTIYLDKSEDEYLFPKNQTASQRVWKYAADWKIKLASVPDTGKKLGKAVYRSQTIHAMMTADLQETAKAGGDLYHPRMTPSGLELYKLGSNKTVYVLDQNEEVSQSRTLEGAVTQVKVIGVSESASDSAASKVLAIESKDKDKFGTLQALVQDDKVKTASAAKTLAKAKLRGIQQTFTVAAPDINIIRAGDAVMLNGMRLIVTTVNHQLGSPGSMTLELAAYEDVRRRYYLDG